MVGSLFITFDEFAKAINDATRSMEEQREKINKNISKVVSKPVK
jgi:flagellar hook-associated protein FlgK